tara:strand:+ start:241 stop:480 length:240 start_codon:yes stop_codon:yes gene_type:complete
MPKYVYKCDSCEKAFEVFHKMTEKQDACEECGAEVYKIPGKFFSLEEQKTGKIVKEKIAEFMEDLKDQKKERMESNYVE